MILLWLICGLMTLAAAVILALPLFDARKLKNDSSFALEVYRDQLAEINRDASRGILDHDQAKAAQVEIERRILALAEAPMFKPARAPSHGLMIALAVVLPLSGFGLYLLLGSPALPGAPLTARQTDLPAAASAALAALEQGVAAQPGDGQAWLAYGDGLMQAKRAGDAANAFAKAIALGTKGARVEASYGSALVVAANGKVDDKARAAFQAALAADPTDPTARFFLGLAKQQAGDGEAALTDWLALERELPADTPWRPDLVANIDQLARDLGKDPKALPGRIAPIPGAREDDVAAVAAMSPEEQQAFINGMVERLAERLKSAPDDLDGWIKLARAYGVLKRGDDAVAAWAKAAALAPGQLDLQVEYANALIDGRADLDKNLPPAFAETVTRIRTLAPENPLGLYYGGLVERAKGDKAAARALWEKVLVLLPANSPQRSSLEREIKALEN